MSNFYDLVGSSPCEAPCEKGEKIQTTKSNMKWNDATTNEVSCWAKTGTTYFPVSGMANKIESGVYRCQLSDHGVCFEKMNIQVDNLLNLPDSATKSILNEFQNFWKLSNKFEERGFVFKRGFLLWGPPGSGKTSAVWQLIEILSKKYDGIVLWVDNPQITMEGAKIIRKIEPNRPIVTVMEDLEALVMNYGEHGLLAFLDGETQISNIVHVATTNYPEHLDKRFVDRPSRFDTIMYVGMPSAEARREYFKAKEPSLDYITLDRWVNKSEGMSIAHLREIIVAIKCFEQDEETVFSRLENMKQKISSKDGRKIGF